MARKIHLILVLNKVDKYILYCRKSTNDDIKQFQSIETQKRIMLEYAKRHNLNVVEIITENHSASIAGTRPEFKRMLDLLDSGFANCILAWKVNRLSRNFTDFEQLIIRIGKGVINQIETEGTVYKESSSLLAMAIEIVVGNHEIRQLKENIRDGVESTIKSGRFPGKAPLGYQNDVIRHTIFVDEDRREIIVLIFTLYSTGEFSLKDIVNKLNELGYKTSNGKKIYKSRVAQLLQNPMYYGDFRWRNVVYKGNHTPLITKSLFDKCQDILHNKTNGRSSKKRHIGIYSRLLTCAECGGKLTLDEKTKWVKSLGAYKSYKYYKCNNSKKNYFCGDRPRLAESKLNKFMLKRIKEVEIDKELADISFELYKESVKSEFVDQKVVIESIEGKLSENNSKKEALTEKFVTGSISDEIYKSLISKYNEAENLLKDQLNNVGKPITDSTFELMGNFKNMASQLSIMFKNGNDEVKDDLVKSLLSNCKVSSHEMVLPSYNLPWSIVTNYPKNANIEIWR